MGSQVFLIARVLGEAVRLYWSHKSVASWLIGGWDLVRAKVLQSSKATVRRFGSEGFIWSRIFMSQKLKICDKGVSQKTGTSKNFTEMNKLSKTHVRHCWFWGTLFKVLRYI